MLIGLRARLVGKQLEKLASHQLLRGATKERVEKTAAQSVSYDRLVKLTHQGNVLELRQHDPIGLPRDTQFRQGTLLVRLNRYTTNEILSISQALVSAGCGEIIITPTDNPVILKMLQARFPQEFAEAETERRQQETLLSDLPLVDKEVPVVEVPLQPRISLKKLQAFLRKQQ